MTEENGVPISYDPRPPEPPALPVADRRLLDRIRNSDSRLKIRVNRVGLELDVVDIHRTEDSICCLVRHSGARYTIPRSDDVEIELDGVTYRTAFLGSWHYIEWMGLHVVVFPTIPES